MGDDVVVLLAVMSDGKVRSPEQITADCASFINAHGSLKLAADYIRAERARRKAGQ